MTLRIGLLFLLLNFFFIGFSQRNKRAELVRLQTEIRQASYYDSATVFKKGKLGIQLARELNSKNDEGLIYQYYGNFEYYSGNIKKAVYFYNKSIEFAKIARNAELVNSTEIRKTFIEMDTDIVAAERHFQHLLNEAKKKKFYKNQIEIYNGLGILNEEKLVSDRSLFYYHRGLKIAEKQNEVYMTAFLLNNIGLLKFNNKQLKDAKKDLERGLKLVKTLNEPRLALNLLNNLGLVYSGLNNTKQAISHYKQTVVEAKKIGFPNGIFAAYLNLTSNYLDANLVGEAKACMDSAKSIVVNISDPTYIGAMHIQLAKLHLITKNYQEAALEISTMEKLLQLFPNPKQQYELLYVKSDLAQAKNNYKEAFEIQRRMSSLSDSINQLSNQQEMSKIQTIYGKERVENELKAEKSKNDLLKTESQLKTANFNLYSVIFIFLIAILIAFFYIQNIRKTKAVRDEYSKNLLVEIDAERSRISKDLHDDIGQALSVIKSKINLHQKGTFIPLEGVEQEIGQVIDQTRRISHELHPSGIEKIGLVKMLNNLIDKVENATGIFTSIDWDFSDDVFTNVQQAQIYRMMQECANNTIKHADANALKIQAFLKRDYVEINYMDNGKGIQDGPKKNGMGFLTLQERVELLGGKFEIKQNQPHGLLLRFQIPRV